MKTYQGGWGDCSLPQRVLFCCKIVRVIHLLLWVVVPLCGIGVAHSASAGALDKWEIRNGGSNSFSDVIWANDLFVAVSYFGPIMTSPDGVTWTPRPAETPTLPRGIAYGNGRFVVVAADGTNLTSTNGLDWTPGWSGTSSELWDVTFANRQFVSVGGALLTSPDGLNWTARDSHGVNGVEVKFGDGKFLVLGAFQTNLLSSDGVNWTPVRLADVGSMYCVGFGGGTWTLVDTGNNVWTSRDARNWTRHGRVEIFRPSEILYAYGTWIMVGDRILSSRDGITWTERWSGSSSGNPLFGVTAGRHTFVAAGYQLILQSDPVLNIELGRAHPRELLLSGPPGRTCRIEFSESGSGDWQSLGTVTLGSDPGVWPVESGTATGFYRAVFPE